MGRDAEGTPAEPKQRSRIEGGKQDQYFKKQGGKSSRGSKEGGTIKNEEKKKQNLIMKLI